MEIKKSENYQRKEGNKPPTLLQECINFFLSHFTSSSIANGLVLIVDKRRLFSDNCI